MAVEARIRLEAGGMPRAIAGLVRDARTTIGWSQQELADRCGMSQTKIWRIERADPGAMDIGSIDRVLGALGLRSTLEIEGRHLAERRRQHDAVHARLLAAIAGRLERCGFRVETELPIGDAAPRGWIDVAAWREVDAALVIIELKTDLPDMGELQRQVSFYERAGGMAVRRLGWRPERVVVAVVCLDTATVASRVLDNSALLRRAFPGDPRALVGWLQDPALPAPAGWSIAVTDLAAHRGLALRPSRLHTRERTPAYRDYAEAARAIAGNRRFGSGRP